MTPHNSEHIIEAEGVKDFTIDRKNVLVKAFRDSMLKILVLTLRDLVFLPAKF